MAHPSNQDEKSSADANWMRMALDLAAKAGERGEIPVAALIVHENQLVASSANLKEAVHDPLGHAEVLVIREAARLLGRWRLSGCTLYVTLEPCVMCAGAIIHGRVDRVVYAARDPKAGAVRSLYEILNDARLNHRPAITAGIFEEESSNLLKAFFRERRTT